MRFEKKRIVLVASLLFSLPVFASGIKDELEFVLKTRHLDFSAPKSCEMLVETGGKSFSSAYNLSGKSCELDESELTRADPALSQEVYLFVCAMLVPALNTTGHDLFGSCSRKTTQGDLLTFSKCGPKQNMNTQLDVRALTVKTHVEGIENEFISNRYEFVGDKLYPKAVELKSTIHHLKISTMNYEHLVPRSLQANSDGKAIKVLFSNCVRNH